MNCDNLLSLLESSIRGGRSSLISPTIRKDEAFPESITQIGDGRLVGADIRRQGVELKSRLRLDWQTRTIGGYMNKLSRTLVLRGSVLILLLLCGCSGALSTSSVNPKESNDLTSAVVEPRALRNINSILLIPLELKGKTAKRDPATLPYYSELLASFIDDAGVEIKGGADIFSVRAAPQGVRAKSEAIALGKKSGVDAVLLTEILTLVEREGSSIGANVPARAGFFMVMISTESGQELWRASYHVTDRALSENLLEVKESSERGARWRTATELLQRGFILAARDFGSRRRSQFLS